MNAPFRLDAPSFIGGASSSGTSLLTRMFSRHPEVYSGQEMSLFNKRALYGDFATVQRQLPRWLKRGIPTDGYSQYFKIISHVEDGILTAEMLTRSIREARDLRDFADRVQTHVLQASGKRILAEKTPSDVYCFRELARLYPRATLIHVVRDGRDVVCSLMKRGFDAFEATSIWLYNTACGVACRALPNYVEVRYEEMVREPEAMVQEICRRVSIPYDPCMLQPAAGERTSRFMVAGAWRNSTSAPVSQQSIGRYQEEMSEAVYAAFCATALTSAGAKRAGIDRVSAFELLRSLGYAAEPPANSASPLRAYGMAWRDRVRQNWQLLRKGYRPRPAVTGIQIKSAPVMLAAAARAERKIPAYHRPPLARSA